VAITEERSERATAREILDTVRDNMRSNLEPLVTEIVAPSLYQVYIHAEDYDRLRSLFSKLEAETKKMLDAELERLNKSAIPLSQKLLRRKSGAEPPVRYVSAEGRWSVRFQEDPNGTLAPGDIEVVSEFAQPPSSGYGAGSKTRRISTTRRLGETVTRREAQEVAALARLTYEDRRGTQIYQMTKEEIVIGREAPDVWVDLRLDTLPDVSREHARLQRTPAGQFRLKDLSKLGTTIDGVPLPRSLETQVETSGGVRDLDKWVEVPDRARIGLAGVVYLDFERTDKP
jgi:hypothetical protein